MDSLEEILEIGESEESDDIVCNDMNVGEWNLLFVEVVSGDMKLSE